MQTPALRSAGSHGIRWGWTAAMGIGALSIALIIWNWTQNFSAPQMTDYLSYWAAGKLAIAGDPAAAYDVARHRSLEFTMVEFKGLLPFPYPPPFLLLVTPFSLLPYVWGFAAWVAVTLAIYLLVTRRTVDAACSLSHPSVLMNGLIGQNGFLTAAIFTGGVSLLRGRPFVAGIILGCLVIKPQLALLLPVAVIAARLWPAIAGAIASAAALGLASLALFGTVRESS